jgi:hypothetical protein
MGVLLARPAKEVRHRHTVTQVGYAQPNHDTVNGKYCSDIVLNGVLRTHTRQTPTAAAGLLQLQLLSG